MEKRDPIIQVMFQESSLLTGILEFAKPLAVTIPIYFDRDQIIIEFKVNHARRINPTVSTHCFTISPDQLYMYSYNAPTANVILQVECAALLTRLKGRNKNKTVLYYYEGDNCLYVDHVSDLSDECNTQRSQSVMLKPVDYTHFVFDDCQSHRFRTTVLNFDEICSKCTSKNLEHVEVVGAADSIKFDGIQSDTNSNYTIELPTFRLRPLGTVDIAPEVLALMEQLQIADGEVTKYHIHSNLISSFRKLPGITGKHPMVTIDYGPRAALRISVPTSTYGTYVGVVAASV
jgi:hypothetical protein